MKGRGKGNEWLLIKKRDEFAAPGWDVEDYATSVLSGRTQEEIARNLPARKAKRETAGAADRVWASSPPAKRAAKTPPRTNTSPARADRKARIDLAGIEGARQAEMPVGHRADDGDAGRASAARRRSGCSKSSGTACAPSPSWSAKRCASNPAAGCAASGSIPSWP